MPERRKRPKGVDPLEAYRKVRKPVPPPSRPIPDRRRKIEEERAESEAKEQMEER